MRLRSLVLSCLMMATSVVALAEKVGIAWPMDTEDYSGATVVDGSDATKGFLSTNYVLGRKLSVVSLLTESSADTDNGYKPVTYEHPMLKLQPAAKVASATDGHCVTFSVTVAAGHTFKPTMVQYDAARVGTDAGGFTIKHKVANGSETILAESAPRRNKITVSESLGFSETSHVISDVILNGGETYTLIFYVTGSLATNKQIALGNVILFGAVDEGIVKFADMMSDFSCMADGQKVNLLDKVKDLEFGQKTAYNVKLKAEPTDFSVTAKAGYTASVEYADRTATLVVKEGEDVVYRVGISFLISSYVKGAKNAQPLNRGLFAIHTSKGNLVSWRARKSDVVGQTQYKLYKNNELVDVFTTKTNHLDATGTLDDVYKVEVCDAEGKAFEAQESGSVWDGQAKKIALAKAPTDSNGSGAVYTPNDATVYDMDGDGEQEIVFRWEPSNVRDGANSGTTGAVYLECVKLDGTQLWRINLGQNIWASQHTITFLCYDFDGDGFGELICRTAPGTVDGEGNFVLMNNDNPYVSYVSSRGRIEDGPEYLTVFDGATGAAISSMHYWPSHADFGTPEQNNNKYGSQARIERYNATLARLDVKGTATPCAVMNHGYYSAAYYMAAYYDGKEIKELWRSSFEKSGEGMYGQGYHTLQSADVDNDGFDEIVVGSGVMDHDGKSLWRSGEGHGDALHIGDFDWDNEGLEVFSIMEDYDASNVHYCMDMRDAKTGTLLWGWPKGDRDCGRGIAADFAPEYDGAEAMSARSSNLHTAKGEVISGTNVVNDGKNFRIYWTGDLYDENMDGTWIKKWNSLSKAFSLIVTVPGVNTINGTKNVPCVTADFLGDWREEIVYYHDVDANNGLYGLTIYVTNYESEYSLPYLRDDALYDNAVAWQNSTYNQPPHLSYSPVLYFKRLNGDESAVKHIAELKSGRNSLKYNIMGQRVSGNDSSEKLIISEGKLILNK